MTISCQRLKHEKQVFTMSVVEVVRKKITEHRDFCIGVGPFLEDSLPLAVGGEGDICAWERPQWRWLLVDMTLQTISFVNNH